MLAIGLFLTVVTPFGYSALSGRLFAGSALAANTPAGQIAAYGFEEGRGTTTADATGHGHTGTLYGTSLLPSWATSQSGHGTALNFTPNRGMGVKLGNNNEFDGVQYGTIEGWVKHTPTAGWHMWFDVRDAVRGFYLPLELAVCQCGANGDCGSGTTATHCYFGAYTSVFIGTIQLPDCNQWHHLAYVASSTGNAWYVDGVPQTMVYQSGNAAAKWFLKDAGRSSNTVYAIGGAEPSAPGEDFSGLIDDVRIYDRPLTQAEIQADRLAPVGGLALTPTATPTRTATKAPTSTPTRTPIRTGTPTNTPTTPGGTAPSTATRTPTRTGTVTQAATQKATWTPTATPTRTNPPISTPTKTPTVSSAPLSCPQTLPGHIAMPWDDNDFFVGSGFCTTGPSSGGYTVDSLAVSVETAAGSIRCSLYNDGTTISEVSPSCRTCNTPGCGTAAQQGWQTLATIGACVLNPNTRYRIMCNTDNANLRWGTNESTPCTGNLGDGYWLGFGWTNAAIFPSSVSGTWSLDRCRYSSYINMTAR